MTRKRDDNDREHDLRKEGDAPVRHVLGWCSCTACEGTGTGRELYVTSLGPTSCPCVPCRGSGWVVDV